MSLFFYKGDHAPKTIPNQVLMWQWVLLGMNQVNPCSIFLQVIEIIIRSEDDLARDVVKHLQRIEEQILESRAWVSSSPVWEAIK